MMNQFKRLQAFTLIELLVSIALSGLLIVLINQQIQNSFFSNSKIKNQLEYRLQIEAIFEFISADINSASHLPNGRKSVKIEHDGDDLTLKIKRLGVSPYNENISGMAVTWILGDVGMLRSILSPEMLSKRLFSNKKVSVSFVKLHNDIFKLMIKTEYFTKSKLFVL